MRLCSVTVLSNHIPFFLPFLHIAIFGILPVFLLLRIALGFLGKVGLATVAMVLNASRSSSSFSAFLLLLFPTTIGFLFLGEVGPATTAVVVNARLRLLFRRGACCCLSSFGNGAHQFVWIWVGSYGGNITHFVNVGEISFAWWMCQVVSNRPSQKKILNLVSYVILFCVSRLYSQ